MAYCHITRDANCIADGMARWALKARVTITFWDGQVPEDASANQLQDVYEQQGMKSVAGLGKLARAAQLDDQPA